MIYMDLEKIYKNRDIPNKYILTLVVSARARELSERKGAITGYDEKFITRALEELAGGKIKYDLVENPTQGSRNESLEA